MGSKVGGSTPNAIINRCAGAADCARPPIAKELTINKATDSINNRFFTLRPP
jgi:hypothetical protein